MDARAKGGAPTSLWYVGQSARFQGGIQHGSNRKEITAARSKQIGSDGSKDIEKDSS
jgi:hypothetical protein